jgi:hypothetical protein
MINEFITDPANTHGILIGLLVVSLIVLPVAIFFARKATKDCKQESRRIQRTSLALVLIRLGDYFNATINPESCYVRFSEKLGNFADKQDFSLEGPYRDQRAIIPLKGYPSSTSLEAIIDDEADPFVQLLFRGIIVPESVAVESGLAYDPLPKERMKHSFTSSVVSPQ